MAGVFLGADVLSQAGCQWMGHLGMERPLSGPRSWEVRCGKWGSMGSMVAAVI